MGRSSIYHLDKVTKIQKSAVRTANKLPFNTRTSPHFRNCNILKLPDLFQYRALILMYGAVYKNNNLYPFHNLPSHSNLHSYSIRNCTKLILPPFSKSKTRMSISYVGAKLWNGLPDANKTDSSLAIFKKNLRDLLMADFVHLFNSDLSGTAKYA